MCERESVCMCVIERERVCARTGPAVGEGARGSHGLHQSKFISHNLLDNLVREDQLPSRIVNLFVQVEIVNNKLTILWGS